MIRLIRENDSGKIPRNNETISSLCGYSVRQIQRTRKELSEEKDTEIILQHGNAGRTPVNTASESEYEYLRIFKEPYPNITIAQFRDFFLEDVIRDPRKEEEIRLYHLQERSISWFRRLFLEEGWRSPKQRRSHKKGDRSHLLRPPSERRGQLVQIDGTPFDWFGNGRMYSLHLAIDDADSSFLAGWFSEHECQYGYCMMMKILFEKQGMPMAIYSDRHSVLYNDKDGSLTQFAMMMKDFGIEMIYALTPQAKGRIERGNETIQLRLPNDIIRFRNKGIKLENYEDLNYWFNDFYIPYINSKTAYLPSDPRDAYVPMDEGFDYSAIFAIRLQRTLRNDLFSLDNVYYTPVDEHHKPYHIRDGVRLDIRIDVFTGEIKILYHGKRMDCIAVMEKREKSAEKHTVSDQKELAEIMKKK